MLVKIMPTSLGFSCSPEQLQAVQDFVGDGNAAADVCSRYDVETLGAQRAVFRYLAQSKEQGDIDLQNSINTVFVLFSGYMVFLMQAGFALLCAGHVRIKNNMNILLKNVLDCAIGTICFYLIGNAFAHGESNDTANPFIGSGDFALSGTTSATRGESSYSVYFFRWAFAAAAATIVAGAVAERIAFHCYLGYSVFMTSFIYPVVSHWLWSKWGWLNPNRDPPLIGSGAMDFAGGCVVHIVGGTAALIGTYFTGPRIGRFNADGEVNRDYRNTNSTLVVLGTCLLWFGWYGFNPGSLLSINGYIAAGTVARTAVTSTLAAGAGGLATLVLTFAFTRYWDVMQLCNGILCGLVAVTASCALIDPWAGIIVGALSSLVFVGLDTLMLKMQLDDVVAAVPMHLGCGALGMLFGAFFTREQYVNEIYGISNLAGRRWGVFFGGDGRLLACNVIACLVVFAWVCVLLTPYFWIMRRFNLVRVPMEQELAGLDASKYGVITTNELPVMPKPKTNHRL